MANMRILAVCAAFALGGCQIWHVPPDAADAPSAPRVVQSQPAPTLPPPTPRAPTNPAPDLPAPNAVTAPNVSVPPPPQPRRASTDGDETVVVRGQTERQVPAPDGDPRTTAERMEHVRAWDRCVMRAQGAAESDPLRPQFESPEDICREALGMSGRDAIPQSFVP